MPLCDQGRTEQPRASANSQKEEGAELASNLTGKVALVTGSSSGIGEATARALSEAGVSVAVNSSTSVQQGEALAGRAPPAAIYVQADIADPEQARRMVHDVVERLGRLDILVNNAGTTVVIPHGDLDSVTPDVWHKILDVNVIGTWQVTVAALPLARRRRWLRDQRVIQSRRAALRQLDPLCRIEGSSEPPHAAACKRRGPRGPGQCRCTGTHRHSVDRRF